MQQKTDGMIQQQFMQSEFTEKSSGVTQRNRRRRIKANIPAPKTAPPKCAAFPC